MILCQDFFFLCVCVCVCVCVCLHLFVRLKLRTIQTKPSQKLLKKSRVKIINEESKLLTVLLGYIYSGLKFCSYIGFLCDIKLRVMFFCCFFFLFFFVCLFFVCFSGGWGRGRGAGCGAWGRMDGVKRKGISSNVQNAPI